MPPIDAVLAEGGVHAALRSARWALGAAVAQVALSVGLIAAHVVAELLRGLGIEFPGSVLRSLQSSVVAGSSTIVIRGGIFFVYLICGCGVIHILRPAVSGAARGRAMWLVGFCLPGLVLLAWLTIRDIRLHVGFDPRFAPLFTAIVFVLLASKIAVSWVVVVWVGRHAPREAVRLARWARVVVIVALGLAAMPFLADMVAYARAPGMLAPGGYHAHSAVIDLVVVLISLCLWIAASAAKKGVEHLAAANLSPQE